MPLILGTNSIKDTGYDVANSLRFNPGSSDTLSKSFGTPTNNKKFTFSFWIKKCENSREQHVVNGGAASSQFYFNPSDKLYFYDQTAGGTYQTTQVFRDVSAWYHIVVAEDTTQGTASSRIRIYVNGSEITDFDIETDPTQNNSSAYNTAATHTIGTYAVNPSAYYLNGYLAEFVFIDGQQLDPTSFGEFDEDSPNIWKPKDVSGLTFGNNGFYLDFENASSLGADVSGNSNNFTVNNLTSIDQSTDTCTNNFATLNALNMYYPGGTLSEGNLSHSGIPAANYASPFSTIAVSQGKWYVEFKITDVTNWISVGISGTIPDATNDYIGKAPADSWGYIGGSSAGGSNSLYHNSSGSTYGATYANNDIIGLYLDLDNNKLYFAKNGTIQNSGTGISITDPTSLPDGVYYIGAGGFSGSYTHGYQVNYGAGCPFTISSGNSDANGYGNFEYSPNDGGSASFDSSAKNFYALNTKNLAEFG